MAKKPTDFFDVLFGNADLFQGVSDMFSGTVRPQREEALLRTFRDEVDKGDRDYLEQAVVDYQSDVHNSNDRDLLQAHVVACVLVDNIVLAYDSLSKISFPNGRQKEALGIIASKLGRADEAIENLGRSHLQTNAARLEYSALLYRERHAKDLDTHREILGPILDKSVYANTFLALLYLDEGDPEPADNCFARAVELSPGVEWTSLNLMIARYSQGRKTEVYQGINSFYVKTGSTLSADDLTARLKERKYAMPRVNVDLFSAVQELLG